MNLKEFDLLGAASISRVVSVYEVRDFRGVPWSKYKLKVLESVNGFFAIANFGFKTPDGEVDWVSGLGPDERTAVQNALTRMSEALSSKEEWNPEDFEWSDLHDF